MWFSALSKNIHNVTYQNSNEPNRNTIESLLIFFFDFSNGPLIRFVAEETSCVHIGQPIDFNIDGQFHSTQNHFHTPMTVKPTNDWNRIK